MTTSEYKLGGIEELTQKKENQRTNASWTLLYVRKGAGMYLLDGRLLCLNESDILLLPPYVSYSFVSSDLGDEYNESIDATVFRFGEAWLDSLLRVFSSLNGVILRLKEMRVPVALTGSKWMAVYSLMNEVSACVPEREPSILIDVLTHLSSSSDMIPLIDIKGADAPDVPEKKSRIERYISCNLLSGVSLDEISSYVGMNRTYFCLFFKRHYGMGLIEYVNSRKIDLARTMLLHSAVPVADVAMQCGFKTVTYFNRVFKASTGLSPKEYRIQTK